jgi:hypothetical protein
VWLFEALGTLLAAFALQKKPLVLRVVSRGLKQGGDVHLFVQFRPVQLLAVQRDCEMPVLRCCRCPQDREPVQWKLDSPTVSQVDKQVPAVEMHTYHPAVHGRLLNEKQLKDSPPQGAVQERMPERRTASGAGLK